ncbi:MAG: hypothetical protein V3V96_03220 [Acidiferrobacterales bacterium]
MANFTGEFVTILFGEAPLVGECIDVRGTVFIPFGQAQETNLAQRIFLGTTLMPFGQATEINVALPMFAIEFFPFLTITEADERCEEQMANGTWVVCHSQRIIDGQISVRFQRFMSPLSPDFGKWEFLLDKTIN